MSEVQATVCPPLNSFTGLAVFQCHWVLCVQAGSYAVLAHSWELCAVCGGGLQTPLLLQHLQLAVLLILQSVACSGQPAQWGDARGRSRQVLEVSPCLTCAALSAIARLAWHAQQMLKPVTAGTCCMPDQACPPHTCMPSAAWHSRPLPHACPSSRCFCGTKQTLLPTATYLPRRSTLLQTVDNWSLLHACTGCSCFNPSQACPCST